MSAALLILAPLRLEAAVARRGAPRATVRRTGMGPRRATAAGRRLRAAPPQPTLVAGVCGALGAALAPGDVVVADELRLPGRTLPCADPSALAERLRAGGLPVHVGPIASARRVATGAARAALAREGALAVDVESAWIAAAAPDRPLRVLRVVVDTPGRELWHIRGTIAGGVRALRNLRRACALAQDVVDVPGGTRRS